MKKKYPTINYIGNKKNVAKWIVEHFPIKKGKVLDLFCGGCSISYELKKQGYSVFSNDILYSSFVVAKAIIENKTELLNAQDYKIQIEEKLIAKKAKELIKSRWP